MPRYLLKIRARDRMGRERNLWCVFSTIVMSCISPVVEARDINEARKVLKRYGFMGVSEMEKEAIKRGYVTESEVQKERRVLEEIRSRPGEAGRLISEYMDLVSKVSSALEKIKEELGVEGYNDRYVEEVVGEIEDGRVTYKMTVYEFKPPKLE